MPIRISPTTLVFKRPLTTRHVRKMHITNNGFKYLAFKVKTTSLKSYGVLPSSGIISPNSKQTILVKKFALKQEPDIAVKCNDKFKILIAYADANDINRSIGFVWKKIESRHEQVIKSVLIPCLYKEKNVDTSSKSNNAAVSEIAKDEDKMAAGSILMQRIANQLPVVNIAIVLVIVANICLWCFC